MRAVRLTTAAVLAAVAVSLPSGAVDAPAIADESSWVVMDDFEAGSLAGWRAAGGGSGGWFRYTDGRSAPDPEMTSIWPFVMPDPPEGRSAATTDMNGWGTFVLYRDVTLDGEFALHLTVFYESAAPLSTAPSLRWDDFSQANQQLRIDILDPSAPFDSVADGDVLVEVWGSESLDPQSLGPTPVRADVSELSGRTVRLRLAVATNGAPLRAGVDHIRFEPVRQGADVRFPVTRPAPGAPAVEALALAAPTGPYPVGRAAVRLDGQAAEGPTVWLWYPAAGSTGSEARYLTPEQSRATMLAFAPVYGPPWDILSTTRTHAIEDAQPRDGETPLVVLLPGLSLLGSSLSDLAVDLASRGYAVAAIDHSVEASGSGIGRALEASRVVDGLIERELLRIDGDRIAVIGHSMGGEAVALAMRQDPRFRAGVSLDTTFPPDVGGDLDRPFLMLDSPTHLDDAFSANWRHLTGWRRWAVVGGSEHMSFTDYPSLLEQLGFAVFGAGITGDRATQIIRAYVAAFLDQHLRGIEGPLLDGPSARFPEVTLQDPAQI